MQNLQNQVEKKTRKSNISLKTTHWSWIRMRDYLYRNLGMKQNKGEVNERGELPRELGSSVQKPALISTSNKRGNEDDKVPQLVLYCCVHA